MGEPVKLSRERWQMLVSVAVKFAVDARYVTKPIVLTTPVFAGSVVFLPAEYVPGGAELVARVQRLSLPPCA